MLIDPNVLITYGAVARKFEKGSFIFHEGASAYFFFQVLEGSVKIFSSNADGKELIQGFFTAGQSFGEPPLLLQKPYPSAAQANSTSTVVLKINKEMFLGILKDYPEISEQLMYTFAERIYQKAVAAQVWVCPTPEEKIIQFFKNMENGSRKKVPSLIPYTRQQIADFTGLRVETVIRTLSKMNELGKVKIIDRKLFY